MLFRSGDATSLDAGFEYRDITGLDDNDRPDQWTAVPAGARPRPHLRGPSLRETRLASALWPRRETAHAVGALLFVAARAAGGSRPLALPFPDHHVFLAIEDH